MFNLKVMTCSAIMCATTSERGFGKEVSDPWTPANKIILWHSQDGEQSIFLKSLMAEFTQLHPATEVKVEDLFEFGVSIHKAAQFGFLPDVLFAPGDMVSLQKDLALSPISVSDLSPAISTKDLATVKLGNQIFGAPILAGNHLMVYWNKSLAKAPPADLKDLNWPTSDSYFFMPFLDHSLAVNWTDLVFKPQKMLSLLADYRNQSDPECAYTCILKKFYEGKTTAILNGEWAYEDSFKKLGQNLGVSPLPTYQGQRLRSPGGTFALMFPKQGLSSPKRNALLKLIEFMQSEVVQSKFMSVAKRIPVHRGVLKSTKRLVSDGYQTVLTLNEQSFPITPHAKLPYFWSGISKGLFHLNRNHATEESTLKIINSTMEFASGQNAKREQK